MGSKLVCYLHCTDSVDEHVAISNVFSHGCLKVSDTSYSNQFLSVNEHQTENEISMFLQILSQQVLLGKDNLSIINGHIMDSRAASTTLGMCL